VCIHRSLEKFTEENAFIFHFLVLDILYYLLRDFYLLF